MYPKDWAGPRECTLCGVTKAASEFSKSGQWTRSRCKACMSSLAKKWHRENPGRSIAQKRRHNLKVAYGLTLDEYNDMLRQQGGVCAVCGNAPAGTYARNKRLAVDHCHETNQVRGLLCQNCNRAIGLLGDDPVLLRKAIGYLLRHKKGAAIQGGQ